MQTRNPVITASSARAHSMPFGPVVKANGKTEFRLWAPAAKKIKLLLFIDHEEKLFEMNRTGDGWYSIEVDATPGMRYQFVIGDARVSDPASKFQYVDVHGRSIIVNPDTFQWTDIDWKGLTWEETVLYELHVGTFTPEGTFAGAQGKLDYLANLGVNAIEIMPVNDFPGDYGWGYDGVLLFAPDSAYGTPEDLKRFIQAAHHKGIQVFLDVVYNHFGPDGNFLHLYADQFFTENHKTAWGSAINFEGQKNVREFFIHNALYWLEEYNMDGLRFDAVHAIKDNSQEHFLVELARRIRCHFADDRTRHLVLENERNQAKYLERMGSETLLHSGQWNDDIHHAFHVIATGETSGYYADYVKNEIGGSPVALLGRALSEGFIFQGETPQGKSEPRGEKSSQLPPTAFVSFLQNHDQIGNRALGERIASLAFREVIQAIASIQLLAPNIPLLFMGEEWGCTTPYLFFCNQGPDLAPLITEGRRNEFSKFPEFSNESMLEKIPDPCTRETYSRSKLDWSDLSKPEHKQCLAFYQNLLELRRIEVVPILRKITSATVLQDEGGLVVEWKDGDDAVLVLIANLCPEPGQLQDKNLVTGGTFDVLFRSERISTRDIETGSLPPYSVLWLRK